MIARLVRRLAGALRTTGRTVARVPDVVDAILVLPRMAQQLEVIAFQTATLREMHEEILRVRGDTSALPPMGSTLDRMAVLLDRVDANTAAVDDLARVMVPLQGAALRLGRAADRVPTRRGRTPV